MESCCMHAGVVTGTYNREGERTEVDVMLLSSLAASQPGHDSMHARMHRDGVLPPLLEDIRAEGTLPSMDFLYVIPKN